MRQGETLFQSGYDSTEPTPRNYIAFRFGLKCKETCKDKNKESCTIPQVQE